MNNSAVIREIDSLIAMLEREKVQITKARDALDLEPAYPLTDAEEEKAEKDIYYRTPM